MSRQATIRRTDGTLLAETHRIVQPFCKHPHSSYSQLYRTATTTATYTHLSQLPTNFDLSTLHRLQSQWLPVDPPRPLPDHRSPLPPARLRRAQHPRSSRLLLMPKKASRHSVSYASYQTALSRKLVRRSSQRSIELPENWSRQPSGSGTSTRRI